MQHNSFDITVLAVSTDGPSLTREQRQTIVSQFYQMDKLVVEGGISVCNHLFAPYPLLMRSRANKKVAKATLPDRKILGKENCSRVVHYMTDKWQ